MVVTLALNPELREASGVRAALARFFRFGI